MVTIEEEIREDLYKVRVPNLEVWKGFQDLTASYLQVEEGKIDKMLYYLQTEDMEHFSREYKRILLYSRKRGCPSLILEFKYTRNESENLEDLALKAIEQIKEKNYSAGMTGQVWYVGLAHRGKKAAVKWKKQIDFTDE